LDEQNNYVERLSIDDKQKVAKSFNILAINLSLRNFDVKTKLFSAL